MKPTLLIRDWFYAQTAGEVRTLFGIEVPIDRRVMTRKIISSIVRGRYERREAQELAALVRPGDRVLDLGGGMGLISALAARLAKGGKVVTLEANPQMIPVIRRLHQLNGVDVEVLNAAVTGGSGGNITFYLRKQFWASSMSPKPESYETAVEVPAIAIGDLAARYKPTVVTADIEGAELDLLNADWCDGVRCVMMEVHPQVFGAAGVDRISAYFRRHGFVLREPVAADGILIAEKPASA